MMNSGGTTLAERIAELRRVAAALVEGADAGDPWSVGVVDMALSRPGSTP